MMADQPVRLFAFVALFAALFFAFARTVPADEQQPSTGPSTRPNSLEIVVKILNDEDATDIQKDQLTNKVYAGIVVVGNVKSQNGGSEIRSIAFGEKKNKYLSFATHDNDRALQIHKGDRVRITATLTHFGFEDSGYVNVSDRFLATFDKAAIEEIIPKPEK